MKTPETPPTPEEAQQALRDYEQTRYENNKGNNFWVETDHLRVETDKAIRAALAHFAQADSQKGDEAVAYQWRNRNGSWQPCNRPLDARNEGLEIRPIYARPTDGLAVELADALIRVTDELEAVTSLLEDGPIRPDPKSTRILLSEQASSITKAQEIMGKRDANS